MRGEIMLPVRQCLMSKSGNRAHIRKIYSHTQSLAQCQHWLARNLPDAERIAVVSNAEAALLAARDAKSARGVAHFERFDELAFSGIQMHAVNGCGKTVVIDDKTNLSVIRDLKRSISLLQAF